MGEMLAWYLCVDALWLLFVEIPIRAFYAQFDADDILEFIKNTLSLICYSKFRKANLHKNNIVRKANSNVN
jgi:hypothetical protein